MPATLDLGVVILRPCWVQRLLEKQINFKKLNKRHLAYFVEPITLEFKWLGIKELSCVTTFCFHQIQCCKYFQQHCGPEKCPEIFGKLDPITKCSKIVWCEKEIGNDSFYKATCLSFFVRGSVRLAQRDWQQCGDYQGCYRNRGNTGGGIKSGREKSEKPVLFHREAQSVELTQENRLGKARVHQ